MIKNLFRANAAAKKQVGIEWQANGLAVVACRGDICLDKTTHSLKPSIGSAQLLLNEDDQSLSLLAEWVSNNGLEGAPCNLVLSSPDYQLLLVEAPDVPEAEIRDALRWRIKDLISIPVDKAAIDLFMLPADGNRGGKKMAYVVVTALSRVVELVEKIKEAGLTLSSIDIAELALRNVAYLKELEQPEGRGVAIVRLVEGGGTVSLYRKGNMYLSRHFSLPYSGGLLDDIPIDSFILEVQRSLDYYERQMAQPPPSQLYVCGENITEDKITKDIAYGMSVPVKYLDLTAVSVSEEAPDESLLQTCVVAMGGALRTTVASCSDAEGES